MKTRASGASSSPSCAKTTKEPKVPQLATQCIACGNPYSGDEERTPTGAQLSTPVRAFRVAIDREEIPDGS